MSTESPDAGPLARSRHTASISLLQAERSVRELRRRKKKARPGMKNELALRLKDAVTKALEEWKCLRSYAAPGERRGEGAGQ